MIISLHYQNMGNLKTIILLLLLFFYQNPGHGQIVNSTKEVYPVTETSKVKLLNGNWKFQYIPSNSIGAFTGFQASSYDDSKWGTIHVPGNWETNGVRALQYGGDLSNVTGLYRNTFTIPNDWANEQIFIRFEGVKNGYELYVNGTSVGIWESAYNPCQFNITPYINRSGTNVLAIRVYTQPKGWQFDTNDEWSLTGIDRDVKLFCVPDIHLNDITITSNFLSNTNAGFGIKYQVSSFTQTSLTDVTITGRLYNTAGNFMYSFNLPISSGSSAWKSTQTLPISNPQLWSAETPSLYKLEFELKQNTTVLQSFTNRIGLKHTEIAGNVFKFNGVPVKLRGVNLHESNPVTGKWVTKDKFIADIIAMKKANINTIRTSHYPPAPYFFDVCDSLGMYTICEVPFGYGDSNLTKADYKDILKTRTHATIMRDKNHVSILMWSLGNENPFTFLSDTVGQYAKQLDPSRPIFFPKVSDATLPAYVDFYSKHYSSMSSNYARPAIQSEYCHSSGLAFEGHGTMWKQMEDNPSCFGGCVWLWADQGIRQQASVQVPFPGNNQKTYHTWLNSNQYFNSNEKYGSDGIVYSNRIPQVDYYVVKKNYSQILISQNSINVTQGTHDITLTIKNKYDFSNLKDKSVCNWYITENKDTIQQGSFAPECTPGSQINQTLSVNIPSDPGSEIYLLHLDFIDNQQNVIYNRSIKLLPASNNVDLLPMLSEIALDNAPKIVRTAEKDSVQLKGAVLKMNNQTGLVTLGNYLKGPFMKVSRATVMGEEERFSRNNIVVNPYVYQGLLNFSRNSNDSVLSTFYTFTPAGSSTALNFQGNVDFKPTKQGWTEVNYALTQKTNASFVNVLECGLSFLLDSTLTQFRWLGKGPFVSYPGKTEQNEYGLHQSHTHDLYFPGNRSDIDLFSITDNAGNGFAMLGSALQIDFQHTTEGPVLTFNKFVQGMGTRLSDTNYRITLGLNSTINGNFKIIPLKQSSWPVLLTNLFGSPIKQQTSFQPFVASYDTYLLNLPQVMSNYDKISSVHETIATNRVKIYPNPVENILYIDDNSCDYIAIFNSTGQLVKNLLHTKNKNTIDVHQLKPGLYFLSDGKRYLSHSFIKK